MSASIWLVPSAQAGSVQGTVTDSATGLPIAGVSLYINQPGITVYTDANGNYSFTDLSAGNKRVSASATNYASINSGCIVTAGSTTILNIKLVHI
ncbi:MAG TPA: carboxypeptidase-like regulatory domain-containing protein [Candidatus Dormibacteraeota bacterium]|nr:carboxypeptidase-like regulatory domain-containing protein [Candidatus Dormibacteraeota bacterium]